MLLVLYHLQLKNYNSPLKDLLQHEQDTAKDSTPIFKVSLMAFPCLGFI